MALYLKGTFLMNEEEFSTKHEQIISHIQGLGIGTRISVRKIALSLDVSEGTAYRAIKEAENRGIVSTQGRGGTVRIEQRPVGRIDKLTYKAIALLVDGEVLGGEAGLNKELTKFVIGAMQLEDMIRYIEAGNLLIVGNRNKAHYSALTLGAGVLITGGFGTSPEVKALADELQLPVISCSYDTFTVAALINKAIHENMARKRILLVDDVMDKSNEPVTLRPTDTVKDLEARIEAHKHNRFPVVDDEGRLIGIITNKDVIGAGGDQPIEQFMTRNPVTVTRQTSIASTGHTMVWEAVELIPVVDEDRRLTGVVSRKDVLKAIQNVRLQPQHVDSFEDQIWSQFEELQDEQGRVFFRGPVSAQMMNKVGNISEGLIGSLLTQAVTRLMREYRKDDLLIDSTAIYFLGSIEIDSVVEIYPEIVELTRRFCKIEVKVTAAGKKVLTSIITARWLGHA